MTEIPKTRLQLRSLVDGDGKPSNGQVLVRVEAELLDPSDVGLLFAGADITAAVGAAR
jgi:hypothetical protein